MRAFKIGILIASALTVAAFVSFSSADEDDFLAAASGCSCNTLNASSSAQCMKAEQETGWFSWLTGDSRSAQFHYLDLLELLTSSEESKKVSGLGSKF
ncbi:hypothetical protein GBO14_10600 [Pseudoalteromonas shioyasakiensis]|jgi:hypothetical protein|uniref:Uncharacterized protein n=1 Tax=Pseudoalteromonas shioyasakiensis TaxID=1190813 RepID=A0ABT6U4M3_9GAMM|nr:MULTISPECIES: hypothetical protein [Pseudoalteromonas]MEC8138612.1 hypothetical protein [Pseudomonadota bacterium]MCO6355165.1 hypothetical protein [Pseudoalteromonas shioyasakiensis]MCO7208217.1 hypothetical protein [Pseudoalteromonas sp. CnMc7-37]MDI4671132.1 hypothetical protein [Pseudoalteromonas shioyasakiensis]MDI4672006.1 hypothetical protein [Pseudoalteromonas shioyasakiensis]|tara:strand:+ start:211 stop:504 length:294 start_codon:yes stop_codon:yes gene_type:complete